MVADPKVNNYGNINKEGFNHIWNSRDYQDLRKSINNHTLKDFAKTVIKKIENKL